MGSKSARDTLVRRIEEVAETSTDLEKLSFAGASLSKLVAIDFDVALSDDAYNIGTPGTYGFGYAAMPDDLVPSGYTKMSGHDDVVSLNYASVIDSNGSVFKYRPPFYYKNVDNVVSISKVAASGYVKPRIYLYNPNGYLQFAYLAGNVGGKMVSKPMLDPLSTSYAHNPISNLACNPSNNYAGFIDACVANGFSALTVFEWQVIEIIALAQSQSGAGTALCAYNDVAPYLPKGNNNNALGDVNDTSVKFVSSGYSNCALTGSASIFAKSTDNGQDSGTSDVNGNMWKILTGLTFLAKTGATCASGSSSVSMVAHGLEVGDKIFFGGTPSSGATYNTAEYEVDSIFNADNFTVSTPLSRDVLATDGVYSPKFFRILKATVHPKTLTGSNILDESNYDLLDLTGIVDNNNGTILFGNGSNKSLNFSEDINSSEYKKASACIPTSDGVSAGGTTEFGNDYLYRYLRHGLVPIAGGAWTNSSSAGVFCLTLYDYSANSNSNVGGFASVPL